MQQITEAHLDTGELIEIDEFVGGCITGDYEDSDGYCYLVFDDMVVEKEYAPSDYDQMTDEDITHVLWFAA